MTLVYAIGDIHGQKAHLDQALDLIHADGGADAEIVFLGDYTDRGPDSRAVIETLVSGRDCGRNWHFIKGNHDRLFTRYVREGREHDPKVRSGISWLNPRLGGTATLGSYGVIGTPVFSRSDDDGLEWLTAFETDVQAHDPAALMEAAQAAVPEHHLNFLENLPLIHQTDDLLFVHAGLRMDLPPHQQDAEDLLWIRDGFLDDTRDYGKLIIHGHTALDAPGHFGNRINLDGGAGYGRPLVPAVFEGRHCWLLTGQGRVPLEPS
ncbi:metallophosphoesterase [Yoonia litorea]|uniref:Serine/threonine protein phosphatase 1 n=1 Tax=Yoonia litorea TaxID=1123755 RepID=A0A1I6MZ61_9RHOB|nr:metallophosphoesterase [Yoonia litorea]SFS20995.1 serine/threonine protein phosphatase 1 [Yoonia litorea]